MRLTITKGAAVSTTRGGLVLAVTSAATFGGSGTFASSLIASGWSPAAAVVARVSLAALVLTVPAIIALRGRWAAFGRGFGRIAAFGVFAVAGCQLFYFNAMTHLSVGVALLLEYLGTVLVVGWLWLRHAQRPRRLTIAGSLVAVAGLALVLDLAGSSRIDVVGVCWGLAAAAGLAVYFVLSAHATDGVGPLPLAWGGLALASVVLWLAGLLGIVRLHASTADVVLADSRVNFLVALVGLVLVSTVFAYVSGIAAARRLGAKLASFVGLGEVLAAVAFAWVLLGQVPTALQLCGGVLIVGGVALVRVDELRDPDPAPAELASELAQIAV
jgi:drug/metabolite transporter (DMT)-like permease